MPTVGVVQVNTINKIQETSLNVFVKIGSQSFNKILKIEIYDCSTFLDYTKSFKVQVESDPYVFNAVTRNQYQAGCNITYYTIRKSIYKFDRYESAIVSLQAKLDGVMINATTGQTTIDTITAIPQMSVKVWIIVGSQTLSSPDFNLEVFDCTQDFDFMKDKRIQVGSTGRKFYASNSLPIHENCKNRNFQILGGPFGVEINQASGLVTIDTTNAIKETPMNISLRIGSQSYMSGTLNITVFDCKPAITFPNLLLSYRFQVGDQSVPTFSMKANSSNTTDCDITSYMIKGTSTDGATTNSANGDMIINTTAAIKLNMRQVFVRVGSQEITSFEFQFEIFDCTDFITFPSLVVAQKFQIDGGLKSYNGSAKSNSSECVIKSYGY